MGEGRGRRGHLSCVEFVSADAVQLAACAVDAPTLCVGTPGGKQQTAAGKKTEGSDSTTWCPGPAIRLLLSTSCHLAPADLAPAAAVSRAAGGIERLEGTQASHQQQSKKQQVEAAPVVKAASALEQGGKGEGTLWPSR